MSSFEAAIPVILQHEGGWVSDPADRGGETNFGISMLIIEREGITNEQLGLPPGREPGWMKPMRVEAAKFLYKTLFWDKYHYGNLSDQKVATKVFDCSVNCGPKHAHEMAQRAANKLLNPTPATALEVDGVLGSRSVAVINVCDPQAYIQAYAEQMRDYYEAIIKARPLNAKFRNNWMKRAGWGT